MLLAPGTRVGVYELMALVGAGGMGEVYRARDSRLGRDVALKVLGPELIGDRDALARFEREARTASSLNHPNIVHIYDIGEVAIAGGSSRFIAMEYVAGETLRSRMRAGATAAQLMPLLAGVADGLAKAHGAGVVHRDVKPDNIMVTHDGHAKIVDFGLAKLIERSTVVQPDTTRMEDEDLWTRPGAVLGTASYMSPEQARGQEADARSDIFSFGCILFEVIAGRSPFKRASAVETLHAVIHDPPHRVETAPELDAIKNLALSCLEKEPDRRPQSAADIAATLRSIRSATAATLTMPVRRGRDTTGRWMVAAATAIAAVAVAIGLWLNRAGTLNGGVVDDTGIKVAKLTNRGDVILPRISPDGRRLAYVVIHQSTMTVMLRDLAEQSERPLISDVEYGSEAAIRLSFTSNGDSIVYSIGNRTSQQSFKLPIIGGVPRLLYEWPVDSTVRLLSPDATHLALQRVDGTTMRLVVLDVDTGKEVSLSSEGGRPRAWSADGRYLLFSRRAGDGVTLHIQPGAGGADRLIATLDTDPSTLSWRQDGKSIAFITQVEQRRRLFALDVATGTVLPLGTRTWNSGRVVRWLDILGVAVVDLRAPTPPADEEVWVVSFPGGREVKVTPDTRGYWDLDATADGRTLITRENQVRAELMVSSDAGAGSFARAVGGTNVNLGVAWTADGKLVYSSNEAGSYDLYVADADGSNPRRLTFDRAHDETAPAASPDNRYVVFVSTQSGAESLHRVRLDGSDLKALTSAQPGSRDAGPQITPDGLSVLYWHWENGQTLWRVSIDGGTPVRVQGSHTPDPNDTEVKAFGGTLSPDGKNVAFVRFQEDPVAKRLTSPEIAIASFPEGTLRRTFPYKTVVFIGIDEHVEWSHDGKSLYYVVARRGPYNLWRQPVDGSPGSFITDFEMSIQDFAWSRDGKRLAVSRRGFSADAVLISNFFRQASDTSQ